MNKRIFFISTCLAKKEELFEFHFRGFYKGIKLKSVLVQGGKFRVGEEYILAIDEDCIKDCTLYAKLIRSRLLFI